MKIKWCIVPEIWSAMELIFVILNYFLSFYLTNSPKQKKFEKNEKMPGDIIMLHKCTKS